MNSLMKYKEKNPRIFWGSSFAFVIVIIAVVALVVGLQPIQVVGLQPIQVVGLQPIQEEVFENLEFYKIDADGIKKNFAIDNFLAKYKKYRGSDSEILQKIYPRFLKVGKIKKIIIKATIDPSSPSYKNGSSFRFYLADYPGKNPVIEGGNMKFDVSLNPAFQTPETSPKLNFPPNVNTPQTFEFTAGVDGFPEIQTSVGQSIRMYCEEQNGAGLKDISVIIKYSSVEKSYIGIEE